MNKTTSGSTIRKSQPNAAAKKPRRGPSRFLISFAALAIALLGALTGCQAPNVLPTQTDVTQPEEQIIQAGDVLQITFPGSSSLDTKQTVRRDGRITLSIIGEMIVTGMTPVQLEKELMHRYDTQLVNKEVTVTVLSSSYSIFVTGAVMKPGKIELDHPITALEAVMEAGGFDTQKGKMSAVVVIRKDGLGTKRFTLNLQKVLDGKSAEQFYLKPFDILYIPEKFTWF